MFAGKQGFITLRDLFRWAERYRLTEQTEKEYDWLQHLANDGVFSKYKVMLNVILSVKTNLTQILIDRRIFLGILEVPCLRWFFFTFVRDLILAGACAAVHQFYTLCFRCWFVAVSVWPLPLWEFRQVVIGILIRY